MTAFTHETRPQRVRFGAGGAAAAAAPAGNPAPVTTATIGPLLRAAWEGAEPR